ncbi:ubiquitin carboxyl-terminal hydrolase 15-like [Vigna unguiculata]|uniref:ubiquitin carboxyl-terminal hydrolase 15-like n=1 Tax=Vigna unguiculata TaxID=3917 RepID=UPI00101613D4|nr:ubiquitin carboxyl-terminal hydrolase 15-like [Vigna unguiculata]XP_027927022.1 ubiquitin carboxyl-terminal hydrolase 15-like [Vigna unguiculata]XP_027927023.1 ubiquitin carboxyl-terminal hydrolase 15-like [Vigna unguiculata]XP_027927024.1 ubiquitin carboxyl-terminal hydrolase 15-like [Vigna unguiculata]
MLEPRESDIPVLFLVLVVLPLVAYILLGKWSETTKKRDRINLLAHLAAEEALRAEEMAVADVIPPVSASKGEHHECARCAAPARTRCSKCKSVRYCSGNCQIIHWRLVHKQECQQLEPHKSSSFPMAVSAEEFGHGNYLYENLNNQLLSPTLKQTLRESAPMDNLVHPLVATAAPATADFPLFNNFQSSTFERTSHKPNRETRRRDNGSIYESSIESSDYKATSSLPSVVSKEAFMRQKSRNSNDSVMEEEVSNVNSGGFGVYINRLDASRTTIHEDENHQNQYGNAFVTRNKYGRPNSDNIVDEFNTDIAAKGVNVVKGGTYHSEETAQHKRSSEMTIKGSVKAKKAMHTPKTKSSKSPKSTSKTSTDFCCSEIEKKGKTADEPKVASISDSPLHGNVSNGAAGTGIMKMMGLKKSTKPCPLASTEGIDVKFKKVKKIKMLFPYDEFVKIFQSDIFGICPRGLLNCGNSCYANAVLQCLTSTKPLVVYLLYRSHSKACCAKDWCLMCELEQHIMILRENGAPLSPSRILWHMRSINCQMGEGSQEDAHEFLRLLIASMQSICLEGLGGEKKVDPRLQETTFIQHTFGGRLQSKVKCLNCNHESERYENIMDLTLEILGWVESLEDALTQFTSPEDLDGENMYRCGRCTAYVRARKQLSIHEAPNILTIVLKRFQEGRYGKINKCITFPEMLDMIPFMTGTGDIPPLYMLYAVVVHLDTLNASFSGHYVSYVKDLQGNWFRIDDTEVQPVLINQVMSEGAYILFYMRSCPRPPVEHTGKAIQQSVYDASKYNPMEMQKPKPGHGRHGSQSFVPEASPNGRPEMVTRIVDTTNGFLRKSTNRNALPMTQTYAENVRHEFSDATSSDWSLFTSSDEASFTTESTRDSFSTVDYGDSCNMDPISSIFNYTPEKSYMKFSHSRPVTRVFPQKGHVEQIQRIDQSKRVSYSSSNEHPPNGNCGMYVYYGSNPVCGITRTSSSQCEF